VSCGDHDVETVASVVQGKSIMVYPYTVCGVAQCSLDWRCMVLSSLHVRPSQQTLLASFTCSSTLVSVKMSGLRQPGR